MSYCCRDIGIDKIKKLSPTSRLISHLSECSLQSVDDEAPAASGRAFPSHTTNNTFPQGTCFVVTCRMKKASQSVITRTLSQRLYVRALVPGRLTAQLRLQNVASTFDNNNKENDLMSSRRSFRSSATIEFPIRRRRRPIQPESSEQDSDEPITSPLKHIAIDDDVEFVQAASALLDKLEGALEPMKGQNDFFEVERFFGDMGEVLTIDLGPKEGKYRIEMSMEDHLFEYSSPISGKVLYVFSAQTGEWVGSEDGHLFEGLLVRDLIRQCRGLPKL